MRMMRRMVLAATLTAFFGAPGLSDAQEVGDRHLELPQILESGHQGPMLLLIPCAGCGAPSWTRFMEANADRFRMIAVTLPGYDASPRPDLPLWSDSIVFQDNALQRLSELVDERELADVVVVGQSFGSLIGLRLTTMRPDAVRALVNVDGSPTNGVDQARLDPSERLARAREIVDDDWAVRLQDPEEYRSFMAARGLPDAESRLLHHGMFMGTDRESMLHYWRENLLRDRNPEFRSLSVPYLDVHSISARASNPDSVATAYDRGVAEVGTPDAYRRVRYWDTSHWIHVERPRALGNTILDFLEGEPPRTVGPFRNP